MFTRGRTARFRVRRADDLDAGDAVYPSCQDHVGESVPTRIGHKLQWAAEVHGGGALRPSDAPWILDGDERVPAKDAAVAHIQPGEARLHELLEACLILLRGLKIRFAHARGA